jgi:1-deoxy-D-xylulose-5-phosphate reductoisomerase
LAFENHPPGTGLRSVDSSAARTKNIVVLGSTGSIGTQTLDVVRSLPGRFNVVGLAAGANVGLLSDQVREFAPRMVWSETPLNAIPESATLTPVDEMCVADDVDLVMVATTGRAGLAPTLAALRAGKKVALSNKEVIVMAGELVVETAREYGSPLLPVDSEPSAIWQCLQGEAQPLSKLIVTASGGPFRTRPIKEIANVTPQEALAHPTWVMGKKITVDSAMLMNKGFEVIECHWLFGVPFDRIDVTIHAQSVVHSMVEFADGSVKAQMGPPDMRLPIQYAMTYPERAAGSGIPTYDPLKYPSLTFEPLDTQRYPCFETAVAAGAKGQTYPAVLSAADEEAVHLFLDGRIGFGDIHGIVSHVLDRHEPLDGNAVEAVLEADDWARRQVADVMAGR